MKKNLALLLSLILALALFAGCGSTEEAPPEEEASSAPAESTEEAPEEAEAEGGAILPTGDEPTADEIVPLNQETPPEVVTANDEYKIVFTFFSGKNTVARDIESSMISAAEKAGVELITMDNELDPVKMNANVDAAIAMGDVDLYILYTNDQPSNAQLVTKLVNAGIPTVSIATEAIAENGYRAPQFNVPDFDAGFKSAAYVGEVAVEKGWTAEDTVFFEVGLDTGGGNFLIRNEGAAAGIDSVLPGIEVVDSSSDGDAEVAFQRTADFLQTLPEGKKFIGWTHSDDMSASMLSAIHASGRAEDCLLVSAGLSRSMLDMLRADDGIFVGSMDIAYWFWGDYWMPHLVTYLNDGTALPWAINAPHNMITPENVNDIYPAE